jgi:formamidopyrimidine-DNA glycosylase
MPELAEAYTMAKQLKVMENKYITRIELFIKESEDHKFQDIANIRFKQVQKVFSIGKKVIFQFPNGYVITSLSMTGKWLFPGSQHYDKCVDFIRCKLYYGEKHGKIYITHDVVCLSDSRTWATVKFYNDSDYENEIEKLGPDPYNEGLEYDYWYKSVTKSTLSRRLISDHLKDQNGSVCGIGNYLRAGVMYQAKIHPLKPLGKLTDDEIKALYEAIIDVCKRAVEGGGLSISDTSGNYTSPSGESGSYQAYVYGKTLCPEKHEVKKIKKNAAAQTIHFCPICQK